MPVFCISNTKSIYLGLVLFCYSLVAAHPMPNSVLAFEIRSKMISCELQLPLKELQFAVPFDVTKNTADLLKNHQKELAEYVESHLSILGNSGDKWTMSIQKMGLIKTEQESTGLYQELRVSILIKPKQQETTRSFTILYDGIMHQVVNHRALVTIRQDWENGQVGENNTEIGTISIDIDTNKPIPFKVNIAKGSIWKGFTSMVRLGMKHISEGTDHLLFLLVLLLSAPLISNGTNWIGSGKTKYTLVRIVKIATAFTIGHSVTLLIGSLGLINPNIKSVEILIALSILITAIHAVIPIFPNKEIYVASIFGLIHGLAFASVLSNLHLETNKLVVSLLGFNIGIEIMQLFVIILVMPWLVILSSFKIYRGVCVVGASLAGIASIAWVFERYLGKSNFISVYIQYISNYSIWIIFSLACFTIGYSTFSKRLKK